MSDVFGSVAKGTASDSKVEGPKRLTNEQVRQIAQAFVEECVDFRDSELAGDREKLDKYYRGETDLPVPVGRSAVVVSKVRDGVRSVVPSLARIFTQTDKVAEFYSDNEEDQIICRDATAYANNVFWKYGGYKALIEASTDALKAKVGVIKVCLEEKSYVSHLTYSKNAVEDGKVQADNVTEANDEEVVQSNVSKRMVWGFYPVPPEEFLIHHSATCVEYAIACCHQREETISTLVEMGFDYEQLKGLDSSASLNVEDKERKQEFREKDEGTSPEIDPSSRMVMFSESYVRIDADGDGIAELRRVCMGGTGYQLLSDEPANYAPFAEFQAELAPHVFYPICLAEDLVQDQDAQTALLRSIIDNAALTNNPRTLVNERVVNLDDVKNSRIGAIIRAREMQSVEELTTPFVAGQTLQVLQYLQEVSEQRSGITKTSQGIDPDALQSTSRVAAAAVVAASDARIEMMARNIAETGVKSLFKCILKAAIYHVGTPQSIMLPEGFKSVNPQMWHLYLSIKVNVGLGSGRIDEKKSVLASLLPMQQAIIEKLGPANPLCNWNNVRETFKTLLRLNGIHDYQTYFPYVAPEVLQQVDQQQKAASQEAQQKQQQAQQAQNDAMVELVRVESQKAMLKYQGDVQKMQAQYQSDMAEMKAKLAAALSKDHIEVARTILEDDRTRDKNDQDFAIGVVKVGMDAKKQAETQARVDAQRTPPSGGSLQ